MATNLTGTLKIPRPATCPNSLEQLIALLEGAQISIPGQIFNFGPDEPGENFRDRPWIKTDPNRNPLGTYTFSAALGKWVREWSSPPGAFLTVYRSSITISADREDKGLLDGWELADGAGVTGLDLRTNQAFFKGTSPEYDYYTLIFIGYGD